MAQQTDIYLSVILPVHNEEKNIGELLREFAEVFWGTKEVKIKKAKAPYAPALEMVYPDL